MSEKYTLKVSELCEGCGICCLQYADYFEESDDGRAKANKRILALSPEETRQIVQLCPCKAIICEAIKISAKQQFVDLLEKIEDFRAKYPDAKSLKYDEKEYSISIPFASGENKYDYSRESAANSAAEREFNNKMYSQINAHILKIVTEYRVKCMKPYYSDQEDNSYYSECNKAISNLLSEAAELLESEGLADDISSDFDKVDVFPRNDIIWQMLGKGEVMSSEIVSTIRREFDSNSFSSLSSYNMYWETDYREIYSGTSFGRDKYKDKYCYRNLSEAFQQLAKDILWTCNYDHDVIEDRAMELIKGIIDTYNRQLSEILESKVAFLRKKTDRFPDVKEKESIGLEKYERMVRSISGSSVEDTFITEYNDKQYFYSNSMIKERYVENGIITNKEILPNFSRKYGRIIGVDEYIWINTSEKNNSDSLCLFNCKEEKLEKLRDYVFRIWIHEDMIFYTVQHGQLSGKGLLNSSATLYCVRIDGNAERQLYSTSFGTGLFSIDKFDGEKLYYSTIGNESISGEIKWK